MSVTGAAFLLMFVVGCLTALVRHPIYGLMTYIAVYYLHPPSRWWGVGLPELRWSLIAAAVTLAATLVRRGPEGAPSAFQSGLVWGFLLFSGWLAIQSGWALDAEMHSVLVTLYAKYVLLLVVIVRAVDSPKHLGLFLWTHVMGCLYLGIVVLDQYVGGRFEEFGGPDIAEANAGALQVVTGIATGGALFLVGSPKVRATLVAIMPFIVNALVATISRSGFLALAVVGIVYNVLVGGRYRRLVRVLSVLALLLLVLITNPLYWARIATVTALGEEVEEVDTGAGRLVIMGAQLRMFASHPLGCGHRCTAVLSTAYLDDQYLTGSGEQRARSSHNTFLSLLVEQGVPGGIAYVLLLVWLLRRVLDLRRQLVDDTSLLAGAYLAVASSLAAIYVGDLFVDYLKFEARIWFLGMLLVLHRMAVTKAAGQEASQSRHVTGAGVPLRN